MPRFRNLCHATLYLLFVGLSLASCRHEKVADEEVIPLSLDEALIKKTIGRLGSGFMVWERSRNGSWEIWIKKLSGGKETRLVREEPGFDHFCPKISPDGKLVAYMSYAKGTNAYPAHATKTGALWVMQ